MKTNLASRLSLLAPLIAVLLLSSPFTTLAQQIPAEVQAKRDAEADLNKWFWINTGCAFMLLPALGLVAGSSVARVNPGSDFDAECGLSIGSILAAGPLILMLRPQPTPPPECFIGKSPEYIHVYTDAYKKRTRSLRGTYRVRGWSSDVPSEGDWHF